MINRYWSDQNYAHGERNAPAWMCSQGVQDATVVLRSGTGNAGTCQWNIH